MLEWLQNIVHSWYNICSHELVKYDLYIWISWDDMETVFRLSPQTRRRRLLISGEHALRIVMQMHVLGSLGSGGGSRRALIALITTGVLWYAAARTHTHARPNRRLV